MNDETRQPGELEGDYVLRGTYLGLPFLKYLAFNFPNMAFLRLSPKLVQKRFGNIWETFHS